MDSLVRIFSAKPDAHSVLIFKLTSPIELTLTEISLYYQVFRIMGEIPRYDFIQVKNPSWVIEEHSMTEIN